jgi:uncharacterized repeat protein (TIGR03803 family)
MKITRILETRIHRTLWPRLFSAAAALGLTAAPLRAQTPVVLISTTNQAAPATFTATLAVITDTNGFGTNVESFAWYFKNQLVQGATNYILNIFDAQPTNAGAYAVVVSDAHGAVTNAMTLAVTNLSFQAPSVQFSTLASFNEYANGAFPQAGVIQGSDGYLYGTTLAGGTNATSDANGTVFKMSTNGNLAWSYEFSSASGSAGANGLAPSAGLVQAGDGGLYGVTSSGGSQGFGTVFRITTNGVFSNLYAFSPSSGKGGIPQAPLCAGVDGFLYGTTTTNGAGNSSGSIFKISTNGGSLVWSYALSNATGIVPLAGLAQGLDGSFYGTASQGGANDSGTIFRISATGVFTNLYSFTGGADGGYPIGGLAQGPDGQLYGTTTEGGNPNVNNGQGYGSVFKITTNGSAFTLLLDFDGTNGGSPEGSLLLAGDGNFYGTANAGGVGSVFGLNNLFPPVYGTVFQLTTNGALTTLLSFDGNDDGAAPHSTLWQGTDGGLYGTTSEGGTNGLDVSLPSLGDGAVFRLGVAPPVILSATASNQTFTFTWNAMPNVPYQAQYKNDLSQATWVNLGGPVASSNGVAGQSDTIGATNKARFYRVSLQF